MERDGYLPPAAAVCSLRWETKHPRARGPEAVSQLAGHGGAVGGGSVCARFAGPSKVGLH